MPTIHTIYYNDCVGCDTMSENLPSFSLIFPSDSLIINSRRPFFYGCPRNLNCGGFTDCVFNSSSDFVQYLISNPQPFSYCDNACIDYSSDRAYQIDLIRVDTGEQTVLAGVGVLGILKGQSSGVIQYLDFTGLQTVNANFIFQLRVNDFCVSTNPNYKGYNGYTNTFSMLNL
uniref:Uncharacterized protein n=1 Tax=viral metagenome TaxID=1070528 RepID=A0A6C0JQT7_9ZZZZ